MSAAPVLFVVGASHHTTPIELRERLALGPERLPQFRRELAGLPGLREVAILNTCNRVEFYGVANDGSCIEALEQAFCRLQNLPPAEFTRIRRQATGDGTIRHLLEVASGLDSQMIGENEIFGQVKAAYAEAQTAGSTGPVLNRIFQKGFQAAKYVRTHTSITEGQISTANVAVDLALTIFGDLSRAHVLLMGAGEIGEKTARAFRSRGAGQLTVASRTLERAMHLATELDAVALPFEHVDHHLSEFDIIVCATAAPHPVLTATAVTAAMKRRPSRPLFLIDLALPRDVEPAVAGSENVFVYNLDDLARIVEANRAVRAAAVEKARVIIEEKTAALWRQVDAQCRNNAGDTRGPAAWPAREAANGQTSVS
jgi:glutamyl-tRNA reductase